MKKKSKKHSYNYIGWNLLIFSVIAVLYFCSVWFLNRFLHKDYLYFSPQWSTKIATINAGVVILSSFLFSKNTIKWLKSNKTKMAIIFITTGICLLVPFLFLKSGTAADEHTIKKFDIFGNISKTYNYEDITKIEIGVQYGIQYDITFKSGEVVEIFSHDNFRLNSFGNSKNIVEFDKIISEYSKKEVYYTSYMTTDNMKYYLKDDESYGYFENIFGRFIESYLISMFF